MTGGTRPNSSPRHPSNPTTKWTIYRMGGTKATKFQKPFGGNPIKLIRHMQMAL